MNVDSKKENVLRFIKGKTEQQNLYFTASYS